MVALGLCAGGNSSERVWKGGKIPAHCGDIGSVCRTAYAQDDPAVYGGRGMDEMTFSNSLLVGKARAVL